MPSYYGHSNITRKLLTSIMVFLSEIYIEKYQWDALTNEFVPRRQIKVPVQYCSHDKFLQIYESSSARKNMDMSANIAPVELQWILPRISVNLQSVIYDTERHINKTNKLLSRDGITDYVNAPVPYNLEIEVCAIAKNLDDSFQIMEQILPYFSPGKSLDIKLYNDMVESIPITLNSISFDFPQDVVEAEERLYTISYFFTMRANYYLQKKPSAIIEHVNVNVNTPHIDTLGIHFHIDKSDTLFEQYVLNASNPTPIISSGDYDSQRNKMKLVKRGEYDSTVTYNQFDLVTFDGNSFIWITQNSGMGIQPGVDGWENSWTFLSVLHKQTIEYTTE